MSDPQRSETDLVNKNSKGVLAKLGTGQGGTCLPCPLAVYI